jgi:hypothetical protein
VNAELRNASMNQELSDSLKPEIIDKDFRDMNISEMTADEIRVIFSYFSTIEDFELVK